MISVGALAIGYLLMNLFATGPNFIYVAIPFGSTSILHWQEGRWWCKDFISSSCGRFCHILSKFSVLP